MKNVDLIAAKLKAKLNTVLTLTMKVMTMIKINDKNQAKMSNENSVRSFIRF